MRFRQLGYDDYGKLKDKGPFKDQIPDPRTSSVVVAEDDGEIARCISNPCGSPLNTGRKHQSPVACGAN
jgi:hypothetical protein